MKFKENKLEIKIRGKWMEVDDFIFRSWGADRRKNGKVYNGPLYVLGSQKTRKQVKTK